MRCTGLPTIDIFYVTRIPTKNIGYGKKEKQKHKPNVNFIGPSFSGLQPQRRSWLCRVLNESLFVCRLYNSKYVYTNLKNFATSSLGLIIKCCCFDFW